MVSRKLTIFRSAHSTIAEKATKSYLGISCLASSAVEGAKLASWAISNSLRPVSFIFLSSSSSSAQSMTTRIKMIMMPRTVAWPERALDCCGDQRSWNTQSSRKRLCTPSAVVSAHDDYSL